jgi:hypothetical protein
MLRFPERALVDAALDAVPFLVVSDLFLTATAERANLVLPARGPFEKTGSSINVEGALVAVKAGLDAPLGTLSDGEILIVLADVLGISLPDASTIRAKIDEAVSSPPAPVPEAAAAAPSGAGLTLIHAETIFSGGGTAAFDAHVGELRTPPTIIVAAGEGNFEDGDLVDLVASDGARLDRLTVRTSEQLPRGTVALIDGLIEAPGNLFASGSAVSFENVRKAREAVEA